MSSHGYPAAKVLLLLRDRIATDWNSLCAEFELNSLEYHTDQRFLHRTLMELEGVGLIEIEEIAKSHRRPHIGSIRVTDHWDRLQLALGLSLADIASLQPENSIVVRPYFGPATAPIVESDVLVLMPFSDDLAPVYHDHLVKVMREHDLSIARADDFLPHTLSCWIFGQRCAPLN